jgi:hypothetical protein
MTGTVNIASDSLGYYWEHSETGEWFGPYNVSHEKLTALIQYERSSMMTERPHEI